MRYCKLLSVAVAGLALAGLVFGHAGRVDSRGGHSGRGKGYHVHNGNFRLGDDGYLIFTEHIESSGGSGFYYSTSDSRGGRSVISSISSSSSVPGRCQNSAAFCSAQKMTNIKLTIEINRLKGLLKANGISESKEAASATKAMNHWMSFPKRIRHNKLCKEFQKGSGRSCSPIEGSVCERCGS